jgi:hypothetical protein
VAVVNNPDNKVAIKPPNIDTNDIPIDFIMRTYKASPFEIKISTQLSESKQLTFSHSFLPSFQY